jgi:hypothetical protein
LPKGWDQIEARKPRFVIFGETHGTRESPALVASIACALSKRGKRLLVAIELGAETNPQLQTLWNRPSEGFREAVVSQLPYFAGRKDGVASEAMLSLIERLHALGRAGQKIDIVAFSGARDRKQAQRWSQLPWQAAHEAEQAENISDAANRKQYSRVLVLAGNAHAQKHPIGGSESTYEPMAMHLASAGTIVSLIEIYGSGTMWNCVAQVCGPRETSGSAMRPMTPVGLWTSLQHGWFAGYDGYYWFPIVHASPPASAREDPYVRFRPTEDVSSTRSRRSRPIPLR